MAMPPANLMYLWTSSGAMPVTGPALVEALRRVLRDAAGNDGAGVGEQVVWYACCFPDGFSRVLNQADSDLAVIGTPGATHRGYATFDEAQLHANSYSWKNLPKELHEHCGQNGCIHSQIANLTHRATAYTTHPMDVPDYPQGPPQYTVTVTLLNFVSYVQTPRELIALVGDCCVCITVDRPLIRDGSNINTASLDLRGTVRAEPAPADDEVASFGSRVPYGEHREGSVKVWAELQDGHMQHVIPFSYVCVADGSIIVPPLDGAVPLVPPAPYVPRRKGWFYWAILQGAHTGIFYAPSAGMRALLLNKLSVARACLTLEEATAFFFEELNNGFVSIRPSSEVLVRIFNTTAILSPTKDLRLGGGRVHLSESFTSEAHEKVVKFQGENMTSQAESGARRVNATKSTRSPLSLTTTIVTTTMTAYLSRPVTGTDAAIIRRLAPPVPLGPAAVARRLSQWRGLVSLLRLHTPTLVIRLEPESRT
ncbi:hypothetical protein PENSPDRAFT_669088 [Peniophora sp. CONT]|nr:hypothetical protein PENSPDRAFT_669088 [Peniophora sp. CONT]